MRKEIFPGKCSNYVIKKVLDIAPLEKIVHATFGYSEKNKQLVASNLNIVKLEILEACLKNITKVNQEEIDESQILLNNIANSVVEENKLTLSEFDALSGDDVNDNEIDQEPGAPDAEPLVDGWGSYIDNEYSRKIEEYIKTHSLNESMCLINNLILNPKPLVHVIVGLSELARREGLLSIEEHLENIKSDFLTQSLQLIIDGTDPETIKSIMNTRINRMHYEYKSILEMIRDGVLAIQNGDNPAIVQTKLLGYLT